MFRNYLIAALRNLARNKLYAAINIVGLAVGFCAAILIFLFIRDESSYDSFIPGANRVYNVYTIGELPGRAPQVLDHTAGSLVPAFKLDFPAVEVSQLMSGGVLLRHDNVNVGADIYWADANIFSVLPLPVFAGNLATALMKPDGLVMTRRMANKFFGSDNPIGRTLDLEIFGGKQKHTMTVTAILADLPSNTNLVAEIFVSGTAEFGALAKADEPQKENDFNPNVQLLIRLAPDQSIEELRRGLPEFSKRHIKRESDWKISLELRALTELHLLRSAQSAFKPSGDLTALYSFATVGLLIVFVAGINFVNLMTARATQRRVEIGIRKIVGARRRNLVVQFIGETLIYAILGMCLAIALTELLLPTFNAFLARDIPFHYWRDRGLLAAIAALVLLVGVLAGLYPAFVLSNVRPVTAFKPGASHELSGWSGRRLLVVVQFAVLIALSIVTGVIYKQKDFATNRAFGLDKDQVAIITNVPSGRDALSNGIQGLPGVIRAADSSMMALGFSGVFDDAVLPDGRRFVLRRMPVGFGFLEFYGLKPLAGRFFMDNRTADAVPVDPTAQWHPPVVINEAAMHLLGYESSQAAIGKTLTLVGIHDDPGASEVIGVVPDFMFRSVRQAVDPSFYYVDPTENQAINVKLRAGHVAPTMIAIESLLKRIGMPGQFRPLFLDQVLQDVYADVIKQQTIFTVVSLIAIFIACLGLLGLSAFTAERRTKEIGVRKALGASSVDVMRLLVWQFAKLVLWANLIAWPVAAFFMNRWLHGFAYHIDLSLWLFIGATGIALTIALLTVSVHCYLVARAKPITALRYE